MSTVFSSSLDEDLMKHLEQAAELSGVAKPKVKKGPRTFVYSDGFKPLLSVIPIAGSGILNIPIRVFNREDWPDHLQKFIPKVDDMYVFDPKATLACVAELYTDKDAAKVGVFFAHGPKGSGKTTLTQQLCARINMPWVRVNCKEDMESAALFGSVKYDPVHGMTWVDGPLAELAALGGTLCIDEISRTPTGINASLMAAFEKSSDIYLSDKPASSDQKYIKRNPWFRIACTDNTELQGDTTGKYVGTNVQDEAFIDRIGTTIKLGYLSEAHETAIITGKVKDIDNFTAQRMVQTAKLIRQAYDSGNVGFTMSPRGLIEWAEKIVFWDNVGEGFKLSFWNKLTPTDQSVVAEFYHSIWAENLR
jgi:cobaltochelatase CobS